MSLEGDFDETERLGITRLSFPEGSTTFHIIWLLGEFAKAIMDTEPIHYSRPREYIVPCEDDSQGW